MRAITTFCWLPPDSADTGAPIPGTRVFNELSSAVTCSTSRCRLTNGPRVNRRSAETAAFSRTVRLIISASVFRSGGM